MQAKEIINTLDFGVKYEIKVLDFKTRKFIENTDINETLEKEVISINIENNKLVITVEN